MGDSHIEQYLPAFQVLAHEQNWRVVTYFHSSCPFSTAQRQSDFDHDGPCLEANADTLASLADLAPDLVVTSSRTAVPFVSLPEVPDPVTGFRAAWQRITALGIPVAVIADNPLMLPHDATNDCVAENPTSPANCERPRSEALPRDFQLPALAEPIENVTLIDLTHYYCTETTYPPVIGNVLVYRDEQHLTPAYMRTVAPYILAALETTRSLS